MKLNKYIALFSSVLVLASCDLDKFPESSTITEDQKNEVAELLPERLQGDLGGLKAGLIAYGALGSSSNHFDYGFPAACLIYDQAGQDMVSQVDGYNWFSSALQFQDRIKTSDFNLLLWRTYYNQIKTANDCLLVINELYPTDEDKTPQILYYLAQAAASRAFAYLQLVQTYQFTYIGHENDKAVPLVLETMTEEEKTSNPRATVQAIYDQIMKDLNNAVNYLTISSKAGVTPADKAEISLYAAHGLRARANLLMGNWKDAAADAEAAYSEAYPYTMEEVSVPAFNSINADSWIWGSIITEENDVVQTGIVNWPSHLCSMTGNGYTTGTGVSAAYRAINSSLWEQIPATDVRKGWWVDAKLNSPVLVQAYGQVYASALATGRFGNGAFAPYTNVKFGPEADELLNSTNAQDWPLMRAEEMLLIHAEALARDNQLSAAKQLLTFFVSNFRDTEYSCDATTLDEFLDEIWFQRRIELWGEGFSLFDVLRLKKTIVRIGANFTTNCIYPDIEPNDPILVYMIPESEVEANNGISDSDNNTSAIPPSPIVP